MGYATKLSGVENDNSADGPLADPLTMSTKQLRGIAGDCAEDLACAYFQHTARVTQPAFFRPLANMLNMTNEKGEGRLFRKGQAGKAQTVQHRAEGGGW